MHNIIGHCLMFVPTHAWYKAQRQVQQGAKTCFFEQSILSRVFL